MKASTQRTIAATLIASAVGTASWFFGFAAFVWPAHPMILALVITFVVSIIVNQTWPVSHPKT